MSDAVPIIVEVTALLRELLAEARKTNSLLTQLRRQAAVAPLADRLLVAAHAVLGNDAFTAPSLLALANSQLSTRLELMAVTDDITRGLDQPGAARRLGKFLAANTGHAAEGLRLVPLGKERGGSSYRVEAPQTRGR